MTENEAIKILKKDSCYECAQGTNSPFNCEYGGCRVAEATREAIKALEEVQQYRTLEKRLSDMFCSSVSLKSVVDELERNLKEPDSPHPMKARILTYKESADWDAYRAIGTPEECRAAVERNNEKTRIIDGVTECCGYDFGIDAFRIELSKFCPVCGRKIERNGEE